MSVLQWIRRMAFIGCLRQILTSVLDPESLN